ncbi:LamG domain-containing protein [Streptomyces sp. NPDC059816]|uniref:LamG domain-containing protein n=1 Tax=Streptomyces sp. NPDC059816 TaxID=3346960 RepID=UPI003653D3A9
MESGDTKTSLTLLPAARAMVLNGSSALQINNASPTGTDFTIERWLKRSANRTSVDTIVSCGTNGLTMGFTASGAFGFGFGTGGAAETLTTATTWSDTYWHHWAVTFNRTTKAQAIYRDGAEVARRTDTGSAVFFNGHFAELRTWNTARSDAEITALKDRPVIGDETGLTDAWSYQKSTTYSDGALLLTDRSTATRHAGSGATRTTPTPPSATR